MTQTAALTLWWSSQAIGLPVLGESDCRQMGSIEVILCTVLIGLLARLKSQFHEEDWSIVQLCQILRIPFLAQGVPLAHSWHWIRWKHNAKAAKTHRKRWIKTLLYSGGCLNDVVVLESICSMVFPCFLVHYKSYHGASLFGFSYLTL
jgi:hypothetical protein